MHYLFKLIFVLQASIPSLDHPAIEIGRFDTMSDCYFAAQHAVYAADERGDIRTAFCVPVRQ